MKIYMSNSANMSRGKYAAHAVHAALKAAGVVYDEPVIVLGAPKKQVEGCFTTIHDAGRTELKPGTLTAGTDWSPNGPQESTKQDLKRVVDEVLDLLDRMETAVSLHEIDRIGTQMREAVAGLTAHQAPEEAAEEGN